MKYQEAVIAWTPRTDQVRVGPLPGEHELDWTMERADDAGRRYRYTGGAVYTGLRRCKDRWQRVAMLFIEFNTLVVRDQIPIKAAHREFLKIDEYRQRISPDIAGAEHDGDILGGW